MKRSEFWDALEAVYGPTLGRSLVVDLYLPSLRMTASEAMDAGQDPDRVWVALIEETGRDEAARWIHRMPPAKGERRKGVQR